MIEFECGIFTVSIKTDKVKLAECIYLAFLQHELPLTSSPTAARVIAVLLRRQRRSHFVSPPCRAAKGLNCVFPI
jgi:hypothetical protein